jgi:hypothetical protein
LDELVAAELGRRFAAPIHTLSLDRGFVTLYKSLGGGWRIIKSSHRSPCRFLLSLAPSKALLAPNAGP